MEMVLVIATIKEVLKIRGGLIEDFKATTRKKKMVVRQELVRRQYQEQILYQKKFIN